MRDWSPTILAKLAGEEVTCCFMIELDNGITPIVRLTDIDQDLTVGDDVFAMSPGFNVSKFTVANGGRPAGIDVDLPFDDEGPIFIDHVKRGVWRGAEVTVWIAGDFNDPSDREILVSGFVGLTRSDDRIGGYMEFVTKADALADIVLPTVQPKCWYHFGTAPCPVDRGPLTLTAVVATVTNASKFTVTVTNPGNLNFTHGDVNFTSGDNAGAVDLVRLWTPGTSLVEMVVGFPFELQIGDELTISAGCAQDRPACAGYGAEDSYSGFDFTPGELLGDN
ncbi:DUF2163 domain-containing protein [Mesorhizobium sp. B2-4-6]|uniref:baseplate hub domain-containing protein n=1 Tax=Mesorhizobium sp. B2-4-6 TaxID=2589943 RepID=UPI001126C79B|nr:DUF2163 domain-containing protein [Mesorhizobium sp. B2-4-6]TPL40703.1 DUF2163 domain-containing protein [Mesorhizobium sp. B2-4-6]